MKGYVICILVLGVVSGVSAAICQSDWIINAIVMLFVGFLTGVYVRSPQTATFGQCASECGWAGCLVGPALGVVASNLMRGLFFLSWPVLVATIAAMIGYAVTRGDQP